MVGGAATSPTRWWPSTASSAHGLDGADRARSASSTRRCSWSSRRRRASRKTGTRCASCSSSRCASTPACSFWNENADALARAEARFGVPAEIIVGIIGVETVYGRNTGRFRVLDALTTLAFAYPGNAEPARRAWPSSAANWKTRCCWRARPTSTRSTPAGLVCRRGRHAAVHARQYPGATRVDFDGDGKVDLRNSAADAIGSVANFLVKHGWQRDAAGPAGVSGRRVAERRAGKRSSTRAWRRSSRQDELTAAGVVSTCGAAAGARCSAWSTCKTAPSRPNTGWQQITFLLSPNTTAVISTRCR